VDIVGSELEALRVDMLQGRAGAALAAIDEKLAEVRAWWARRERREPVPEAPDGEILAQTLVGGLNIATEANLRLEHWQASLDLLGEEEKVLRALGASEHALARTRFNTHAPLLHLSKLAEAKAVLEGCLEIFRGAEDVTNEAMALSALADVWGRFDDPHQATAFDRRALALRERLPDPESRAISHNNLANDLHATGASAEAGCHQLAAISYHLATGIDINRSLPLLAFSIREAAARNVRYDLPRLADVLTNPAFSTLRALLDDRGIAPADLQAAIDHLVERVRAAVAAEPPEPA
jgi:tetratricopeptide (TPR) repeat protein